MRSCKTLLLTGRFKQASTVLIFPCCVNERVESPGREYTDDKLENSFRDGFNCKKRGKKKRKKGGKRRTAVLSVPGYHGLHFQADPVHDPVKAA